MIHFGCYRIVSFYAGSRQDHCWTGTCQIYISNIKTNPQTDHLYQFYFKHQKLMENPERGYSTIDVHTMYKYDNHTNIPWNIKEYHTPKEQYDASKEILQRKYSKQKKGEKDKKHVTKKGFYMDYDIKVAKTIPAPNTHNDKPVWATEKEKKRGQRNKIDQKLMKYTYLDRIQMEQKNRKSPGICAYSLEKSLKEKNQLAETLKKRKYNIGEKPYFYQNTERLSEGIPGAGNYCPHIPVAKERLNKTDRKFWQEKHKKETQTFLKRQAIKPASGTYSPMNVTISTFDEILKQKDKPSKKKYMGSDSRFEYTRPNLKKIQEVRPGPSNHATMIQWKGKGFSPKKQTWNEIVTKTFSPGVYH